MVQQMLATALGIVGGGVVTILTAILVEYCRRPSLRIGLHDAQELPFSSPPSPAHKMRVVNLGLTNRPLPRWIAWMSRNTAVQCHGTISFHHMDGQNVFGRTMSIRWGRSPEPVPDTIQLGNNVIFVRNALLTLFQRMDVHPGETEILNVAARFDQDQECYGWSNANYFSSPLWRIPEWKLPQGRFLIKVSISSAGEKCNGLFRLINDVPIKDFRLEPAQRRDVAHD